MKIMKRMKTKLLKNVNTNNLVKNKNQDLVGLRDSTYNNISRKKSRKILKKINSNNHKIKSKHSTKKTFHKKQKEKNKEVNNKKNKDDSSLNSSYFLSKKCQSLILESYKIYNNFNKEILSENEKQNLSDENNEKNENKIIKKCKYK